MSVRDYLDQLILHGIAVRFGVIFGSQASGSTTRWSDIDLLVVSPRFDGPRNRQDVNLLWRLATRTDSHIEPIPCGDGNGKRIMAARLWRWHVETGNGLLLQRISRAFPPDPDSTPEEMPKFSQYMIEVQRNAPACPRPSRVTRSSPQARRPKMGRRMRSAA